MDKRIIFAVAGAGKTTYIIDRLSETERFLITTYTTNNVSNLRRKIIEKFGFFPQNITVLSYLKFLYSFCCKPCLGYELNIKGLRYTPRTPKELHGKSIWKKDGGELNHAYFMSSKGRVYSNRIAKLLEVTKSLDWVNQRIEKYFDNFFIDEVQDFSAHDFNFLGSLVKSNVNICLVGDFYQHTFDTSLDGRTNATLYGKGIEDYKNKLKKMGLVIDEETLTKSYRCSPTICEFIEKNLRISIASHQKGQTEIKFLKDEDEIRKVIKDDEIIKLFYKQHYEYQCFSQNWGASKGEDHYNDVCIVLNQSTLGHYEGKSLADLPPSTKNKLYVACSRARNNLYFVDIKDLKEFKRK